MVEMNKKDNMQAFKIITSCYYYTADCSNQL